MIPPRKHLLKHQPINTQIALMVGDEGKRGGGGVEGEEVEKVVVVIEGLVEETVEEH